MEQGVVSMMPQSVELDGFEDGCEDLEGDVTSTDATDDVGMGDRLRKLKKRASIRSMMTVSRPSHSSANNSDSDDSYDPRRNEQSTFSEKGKEAGRCKSVASTKSDIDSVSMGSLLEASPVNELQQLKQTLKNLAMKDITVERRSFMKVLPRRHSEMDSENASHRTPKVKQLSVFPMPSQRSVHQRDHSIHYSTKVNTIDPNDVTSGSSNSHGSRAVLSALKALQDKIRRLEEERESLLHQHSDLKARIRQQEAEMASVEKKRAYDISQVKESSRAAYDSLRLEREELRLQLAMYEERKKSLENELKHFQSQATTYHTKAIDLDNQVQQVERQYKRLVADMETQRKKYEDEMRLMHAQIEELEQSKKKAVEHADEQERLMRQERAQKEKYSLKLEKSEQTIVCISQLNEKLVQKLWEAIEDSKHQRKQQIRQQKRIAAARVKIPVAERSTAASRAATSSSARLQTSSSTAEFLPTTSERSYVRMAQRATSSSSSFSKKTKTGAMKKKSKPRKNNLQRLKEANLGKDIPFLIGQSTSPSFSLIANIQDTLRQCDTSFAVPNIGSEESHQSDVQKTLVAAARSLPRSPTSHPVISTSKTSSAVSDSASDSKRSELLEQLGRALASEEKEFIKLNDRYKDAISRMEKGAGILQPAESPSILGPMLDELEAKSKQVQLLKQAYDNALDQDRVLQGVYRRVRVHSPEAVRRKTVSLRLLNEYRQMERDAKGSSKAVQLANQSTVG